MTPEEIEKQKKIQEAVSAKAAEFQKFVGKSFVQKGDKTGTVIKIHKYNGIVVRHGIPYHTFMVDKPGAMWCPAATQFLAEHDEIEVKEQQPKNEEAI